MHTPLEGGNKAVVVRPVIGAKLPSVFDRIKLTPVKERVRDTRGHASTGDARNVIDQKKQGGAPPGYHP